MRSLRTRVALAALMAMTLTLVAVLTAVVSTFAARERSALDARVTDTLDVVAGRAPRPQVETPGRAGRGARGLRSGRRRIAPTAATNGVGVIVTSLEGEELARYGLAVDNPALRPLDRDTGPRDVHQGARDLRAARSTDLVRINPSTIGPGSVTVLAPREATETRIDNLRSRILVIGGGGLLLSVLMAYGFTRLALGRLDRLRDQAAAITPGGATRLSRGGPTEVDALSATLNELLARVERSDTQRNAALEASRRFAADAGHEMRTPLTTMGTELRTLADHGELSAEQREIVGEVLGQQGRLNSLLRALQALARGDTGAAEQFRTIDLDALAGAAVEHVAARHPDVTIAVSESAPGQAGMEGWEDGLRIALDNLLENAALHGGRHVTVELRVDDADTIEVVVDDDGPGVPVDERDTVVHRFRRGQQVQAPGSGLGLPLVVQQAQIHGGDLRIEDAPGGGARFVLALQRRNAR